MMASSHSQYLQSQLFYYNSQAVPSVCSDTCSSRSRVHNYIQVRMGKVCINWENHMVERG